MLYNTVQVFEVQYLGRGGEGGRKWAPLLQMSHHLDFRTSAVVPATHPPAAVATPYNPSSNLELLYNTGALTKSSNLIE